MSGVRTQKSSMMPACSPTRLTHTAACALAKANRRAEAMLQVKRALDDDYFGCEQMERDADLDSLRHSEAFKRLFAKWRAQHT
jgi:hypothetical protein